MGLAKKLEQEVTALLEIETKRAGISARLLYDKRVQKNKKLAEALNMQFDELTAQKCRLWKELFED